MAAKRIYLALLFASVIVVANCDISEYFLRDPYTQRDLFSRHSSRRTSTSNQYPQDETEASKQTTDKLERRSSSADASADGSSDDYYDDYYDFLYEAEQEAQMKRKAEAAAAKRRVRPPKVAEDVLKNVKPRNKSPYQYRRPAYAKRPNDNIAMPSHTRTETVRPYRGDQEKKKDEEFMASLDKVERLIPSSIKTIIEDSGKRIVKSVLEPVNDLSEDVETNLARKGTQVKESTFASKMGSFLTPYRTYFGYMAPTFAPDHITTYLVAQWVSTFAITAVWIVVGYMYNNMFTGRSNEARSAKEPWEQLIPDSETVAYIFQDLAVAAQRWHDEL